ncbi:hypothetical protein FAZ69_13600 [Trinickia terrae]|uniref:Uncharacterized protein n=1 Tax=Trinickia terrae TaxID=2571161 RepID=A0A4U1I6E5_9BURK|nr:hypothetical protein [Trinickia terrae]TKC88775.1 hypothetical protein FAZ69_13600 [Trinickia terrae]
MNRVELFVVSVSGAVVFHLPFSEEERTTCLRRAPESGQRVPPKVWMKYSVPKLVEVTGSEDAVRRH